MTATATDISTRPDLGPTFDAPPGAERGSTRMLWSDTLVFARRNMEHVRQIPEKLLDVTIQPIMFVLLFGFVFGGAIAVGPGNYREFLIAGILIQTLAFGLMGPSLSGPGRRGERLSRGG